MTPIDQQKPLFIAVEQLQPDRAASRSAGFKHPDCTGFPDLVIHDPLPSHKFMARSWRLADYEP
ncbi:MAG TPA: hypothetical protein VF777_14960 [Phycisphaerales bacterium]